MGSHASDTEHSSVQSLHIPPRSSSVQLPDDGVNVRAAKAGVPQVLEEPGSVAGGVASHRQLERQQEIVGGPEAFANRVDLVDEVLQADDAVFSCGPRRTPGEKVGR